MTTRFLLQKKANEERDVRENLIALRPRLDDDCLPLLIFVNKGIEIKTNALTLEIIADTCGPNVAKVATFLVRLTIIQLYKHPALILSRQSGPSFAKESE